MCQTCTAEMNDLFYGLKANDPVVFTSGEFQGRPGTITTGTVVHTNGPRIAGVRRIQVRLDAGALVIVPETDLMEA